MRRLPSTLAAAGLLVALTAAPALAAGHRRQGHGYGGRAAAAATSSRKSGAKTKHTAAAGALFGLQLAPSVPADPTVDGAKPGALPWVLKSGSAIVSADGRVVVHLAGFLIPGKGVGPVKTLTASLYCGGSTTAAATTAAASLSSTGGATVTGMVKLPKTCLGPVVLLHPNGQQDSYVAAGGWMR